MQGIKQRVRKRKSSFSNDPTFWDKIKHALFGSRQIDLMELKALMRASKIGTVGNENNYELSLDRLTPFR